MTSVCMEEFSKSWTDDLPKCKNTGTGAACRNSQWNGKNFGSRTVDCSFYCEIDEHTCLYAIFSGHKGSRVAELAMQRIAAEIILGQLIGKKTDEEVREVLRQAFLSAEKCYQDSIDNLLVSKAVLQCQISDDLGNYQEIVASLQAIERELAIGASAALCLIYNSKLFICNIGSCRVLLCRNDENNAPRVIQFSVDHNLFNEDEILRLRQIGIDVAQLKKYEILNTRCIGYYTGKGGYKECQYLAKASTEPIISRPEIVGGIAIDASFRFLLLMSSGTCKCLQEIFSADSTKENREIVKMCAKELQVQMNITDVAQSVVNQIVRDFDETKLTGSGLGVGPIDDLTLMVRNFHTKLNNQVTFNSVVEQITNGFIQHNSEKISENYSDTATTTSSIFSRNPLNPNENRKISSYVDFRAYYENISKAKKVGSLPDGIEFD